MYKYGEEPFLSSPFNAEVGINACAAVKEALAGSSGFTVSRKTMEIDGMHSL